MNFAISKIHKGGKESPMFLLPSGDVGHEYLSMIRGQKKDYSPSKRPKWMKKDDDIKYQIERVS